MVVSVPLTGVSDLLNGEAAELAGVGKGDNAVDSAEATGKRRAAMSIDARQTRYRGQTLGRVAWWYPRTGYRPPH